MLKFISNPPLFNGVSVEGICGNANGSYALKTTDGMFHLFAADGTYIAGVHAYDVRILSDNSYFVQELPPKGSSLALSFLKKEPVWNLYGTQDAERQAKLQNLHDCEVYANGWYRTVDIENRQALYRADHQLIAESFKQCAVFKNGYAIRTNESYYKLADWMFYTPNGNYLNHYGNVPVILGNGFPYVCRYIPNDGTVYEPEIGNVIASNVCDYKTFPNGRFVLFFRDRTYGRSAKIYAPDGHCLSTAASDAVFLPDGRFIQFANKRISALYRPNGLLHTDDVWNYEIAGSYYLLSYEGVDTLYNDKSEDLGDGYGLIASENNFVLFENEQAYHLFNQTGHVLSLDMPN